MNLYDTDIRHRNPDTSSDLILPVTLVSTASLEVMKANVMKNSQLDREWLIEKEAHDEVSLICGAGPSLVDTLPEIKSLQENGAKVFAVNSAAQFLMDNDIYPDYQVILDPSSFSINELGPAKHHLFASIVPPELFEKVPEAILWHPLMSWIEDCLSIDKDFHFIGGGITVSNSTLCIVYTLGFREIHCFGMDSSHRGTTHATPQPVLEGQLHVDVESKGKLYKTTYDFKQQVIVFEQLYKLLVEAGCKIKVYGSGLLPDLYTSTT